MSLVDQMLDMVHLDPSNYSETLEILDDFFEKQKHQLFANRRTILSTTPTGQECTLLEEIIKKNATHMMDFFFFNKRVFDMRHFDFGGKSMINIACELKCYDFCYYLLQYMNDESMFISLEVIKLKQALDEIP